MLAERILAKADVLRLIHTEAIPAQRHPAAAN
jgi:hypothetical protein